jgi:hypothetical protein
LSEDLDGAEFFAGHGAVHDALKEYGLHVPPLALRFDQMLLLDCLSARRKSKHANYRDPLPGIPVCAQVVAMDLSYSSDHDVNSNIGFLLMLCVLLRRALLLVRRNAPS